MFGPMSKKKILKGIQQHIDNYYLCIEDNRVSDYTLSPREIELLELGMKEKIARLNEIAKEIDKLIL